MIAVSPQIRPPLDPDFIPAALWVRGYEELVANDRAARRLAIAIGRPEGWVHVHEAQILSADHRAASATLFHVERLIKFLLWQIGGSRVALAGANEIGPALAQCYSPAGARAFDAAFMGGRVYGQTFAISALPGDALPAPSSTSSAIGRHLGGCRIGFDLGGSDRKAAALVDGEVVYSEEIPWDPYFQKDPAYHLEGVEDSLRRAAAHLPRVDAIGGSAAGIYVNNEVRVASLFRGVAPDLFEKHVRRMFVTLQQRWGVPFEVINDGEVTALAGSMSLKENAVLGLSLGTSTAGGYVTPAGNVTTWLNELAFTPVDYRPEGPRDEWSGDTGVGVQYLSQQAVGRLAAKAGRKFDPAGGLPTLLSAVQAELAQGDRWAREVFESIGVYLGYSIAHYATFYDFRHVLLLGRVTSGDAGSLVIRTAERVLATEFPDVAERVRLSLPDERNKRHGQAIAAASLPMARRV